MLQLPHQFEMAPTHKSRLTKWPLISLPGYLGVLSTLGIASITGQNSLCNFKLKLTKSAFVHDEECGRQK